MTKRVLPPTPSPVTHQRFASGNSSGKSRVICYPACCRLSDSPTSMSPLYAHPSHGGPRLRLSPWQPEPPRPPPCTPGLSGSSQSDWRGAWSRPTSTRAAALAPFHRSSSAAHRSPRRLCRVAYHERLGCGAREMLLSIRDGHTRGTRRRDVCGRPFSDSLGVGRSNAPHRPRRDRPLHKCP